MKRDRTGGDPNRLSLTIASSGGSATGHEPGQLGLMIAQRLIRLMDGSFELVTGPAEFSQCRFTCRLPPAQMAGSRAGADPSTTPSVPSAKLLVVEENLIHQEAARTILQRAGYAVDGADDAGSAIEAVQANGYDLVLLSVRQGDWMV